MSMTDIWAYNPEICDGDFCPLNCDICSKRDDAMAANAEESYDPEETIDLDMGFDPYLGCYTDDC